MVWFGSSITNKGQILLPQTIHTPFLPFPGSYSHLPSVLGAVRNQFQMLSVITNLGVPEIELLQERASEADTELPEYLTAPSTPSALLPMVPGFSAEVEAAAMLNIS